MSWLISADNHISEPTNLWQKLPEHLIELAPRVQITDGSVHLLVENQVVRKFKLPDALEGVEGVDGAKLRETLEQNLLSDGSTVPTLGSRTSTVTASAARTGRCRAWRARRSTTSSGRMPVVSTACACLKSAAPHSPTTPSRADQTDRVTPAQSNMKDDPHADQNERDRALVLAAVEHR
jgi:hypothetical protein